jgi:hypothetical protein
MGSTSWITTRKRDKNPFGTISKLDNWNQGFFFLPSVEADLSWRGGGLVQDHWNLSVELPGRRELAQEEKTIVELIGKIAAGYFHDHNLVYSANFFYFQKS